ncbi:unnamed protein product [Closterium sp. NIES-64]|nr:unnamed protein product [Closterium sp. NIES-65]CAI5988193.1 unnamed protein product [Closterium sp. NIES-64]
MAAQQAPNMQGMSFNAAPPPQFTAPPPQFTAPPPQYAATGPAPAPNNPGCCCDNNKRSPLYTWFPFGLRIGIFLFCLVSFSLCFATKEAVTGYAAGAFLVGVTILGFILALMLFIYNAVRMCVAGSEAYDAVMDLVQFFETYIMSLLLFAAATSAAAACNMWWNASDLNSAMSGNLSDNEIKNLLVTFSMSNTVTSQLSYGTLLKQIVDDANANVSKVRGACAMAYFAAFIYIAMFWYYIIRIHKRGMLKAIADAAVPPAGKANVPPYNV